MSTDPENPTAAAGDGSEKGFVQYLQDQPGSVPAVLVPPVTETDVRPSVLESFTYLFRCDQWLLVLIIGGASIFLHGIIPFVPLMFFIGFALFFVEQSIRYPESDPFGFDFDHFSKYLERGLWPVLAQIALTFLLSIPYGLFMLAMFLGTTGLIGLASGPDSETAGIIAIVAIGLCISVIMVVVLFGAIFFNLLCFRAGMASSFVEIFRFGWAWDFFRKCFSTLIVGFIGLWIMSVVMFVLGLLIFCVGYYATTAWTMLASFHFVGQCYRLYLQRGGIPIPLKADNCLESVLTVQAPEAQAASAAPSS